MGTVLIFGSLALKGTGVEGTGLDVLLRDNGWITGISEVTGDIAPLELSKNILGTTFYVLGLGLATTA